MNIHTKTLVKMLEKAQKVIDAKSKIPSLTAVKGEFDGNVLKLVATNIDTFVCVSEEAYGDALKFTISDVAKATKKLKCFDSYLEITESNAIVSFSDGKKSMSQKCLNLEDFLEMPNIDDILTQTYNAEVLAERFNAITYAVDCKGKSQSGENVLFDHDKIVAVDGYRLAISTDKEILFPEKFLVHHKAVLVISALLENKIEIGSNVKYSVFKDSSTIIVTKSTGARFIDYERVIPVNFHTEVEFDVEEIKKAVSYISMFATTPEKMPMVWTGETFEITTPKEKASVDIGVSANVDIGFNSCYLLDALKHCTHSTVTAKIQGALSPMLIEDGNNIHLVLPVRFKPKQ